MNVSRKVFINRQCFKNALQLHQITAKELSKRINIPYDTVRYCIQRGQIMPDTLETICKYLDVSPEYIQGKTSKKALTKKEIEKEIAKKSEFFSDPEEIEYFIYENERRTDPEGLYIVPYSDYQDANNIKKILAEREHGQEMMIDYFMEVYRKKGKILPALKGIEMRVTVDRTFFEKHFDEIKKRIDETVISYIVLNSERDS